MSSILNKFKKQTTADTPNGIKLENTSFGQQAGTYQPPIIPAVQLTQSNQPRQKGRPGGGWDDEPQPQPQQISVSNNKATNSINLLNDTPPKQNNDQKINQDVLLPPQPALGNIQLSRITDYKRGQLLTYEELELGGFDYEFHLVDEAIKLGGIKLKQSDNVLKDFTRAIATIQEQLIGSILLNKLHSEDNWKVQIRCIYAIQYICQQYQNYREFFQINQQYLRVETDQQLLSGAIDQTLAEVNGQQVQKQKEFQFEFREPPKTQQQPVQNQQTNLIDILDVSNNDQQQQKQQQQKLNLKQLKIKQPTAQTQQQPIVQQQQPIVQQQQQIQQKNTQQINLLEVFSEMSLEDYNSKQSQPTQQQSYQQYSYQQQPSNQQQQQQQQQQSQQTQNGISFDDLLNSQTPNQQQAQPKKNAFGFLKKDQQQQQQTMQNNQQAQQPINLLYSPQQFYQQPQIINQVPQQQQQFNYNQSQNNSNQQMYLQHQTQINNQQQSQNNKKDLIDFLNM